jgi:hypothetical protein
MKMESFVILLHFMPKNHKNKHRFWDDFYESKDYKRYFKLKRDIWFPKSKWREQGHSIVNGFYSYLKLHFPNPIPYPLFFLSGDGIGNINDLADKWLTDILSGESFYKRNKNYFNKTEVKYFLMCNWCQHNLELCSYRDLIKYYFDVKMKANHMEFSSDFFTDKFRERFTNIIVHDYFRFICRNKKHIRNQNEIGDIWDFLRQRDIYDFDNMTWQQLRHNSDEWHEQLIAGRYGYSPVLNKEWKKTTIKDFTFQDEGKEWTITEITSGKLLYDEGKDMHNCVFSYLNRCISGNCMIFSVKERGKKVATLEISREFRLVQVKSKYNGIINEETKKIIISWAEENNINYNYAFIE